MGLEFLTRQIQLKDSSASFQLSDNFSAFVYGLSGFEVWFSDDNQHNVQTFQINVTASKPSASEVVLTPTVQLLHNGSAVASPDSYLTLTVAGWVGDGASSNVGLGNSSGLGSASASLPAAPLSSQPLMAGFDLSYGSDDHYVQRMKVSTGASPQGSSLSLSGTAAMHDKSGHSASTATADVGYIASLKDDPGFSLKSQTINNYGTDLPIGFQFGTAVDEVAAFITDYDLSYDSGEDRKVYKISMGYPSIQCISLQGDYQASGNVNVLLEDSDNHQAEQSSLTMVAIGRHKSS